MQASFELFVIPKQLFCKITVIVNIDCNGIFYG